MSVVTAVTAGATGRIAYVDPVSGASGDMLLGALLDAGLPIEALREALAPLATPEAPAQWTLEVEAVTRGGFAATRAHVTVAPGAPPRTLANILQHLATCGLHPADAERAATVFALLGAAEAAVHGSADLAPDVTPDVTPDPADIHLHEVGAVDALVDIVGVVAGLRLLGIDSLFTGPLPLGGGTVRAAHGVLPVPAPAVAELLRRCNLPIAPSRPAEPAMELVTPTGAALLGALATPGRPAFSLDRLGVGAGGRDPEHWPNVLRLWLGQAAPAPLLAGDDAPVIRPLVMLEANIDDMSPEHVPFLIEQLRDAGALDAWWAAEGMKKGRPGLRVTACARPDGEAAVAAAMLRHSSTLGVRVTEARRYEAQRELVHFESRLGPAVVKVRRLPETPPLITAEYEVARELAAQHHLPLAEVYRLIVADALAHLDQPPAADAR